ncbi:cytochrome C oxidase subunit IV family protein [Myxococcus sp. XM-1-1-1]|jgi:cytochrome c oxidase subunit 4|uniref:cytochrome C oxidase subunit IV family protein n=1 Tax=Myxococcus sp. XM-1-1-1 TaxID=2874602 RepID=UPI001CBD68AC|nr:cytochrome C oxidase subunit IV family protein [Myxococcus sp. XM-1-1-1]MBZ4410377.1 cytochrome C oxidase subunit IV family protein [Myxococcus sp. XM-1-1-1]BDT37175.1 cytochrome C oxidase subunit IV family protein [Myxococcus sp. MH1]
MAIANESHQEEKNMTEHHGAGRYWLIWGVLLVLTVVTVVTGRMHLPSFGLLLAIVIATVKGTLVTLYFMHLAEHQGVNRLIFAVSIVFVILALVIPMADLGTRFRGANPPGSQYSDLQPPDIGTGEQRGRFGGGIRSTDVKDSPPPAPSH